LSKLDETGAGHILEEIPADGTGIRTAVPDGFDDMLVIAEEEERPEVAFGVQSASTEFAFDDDPPGEGAGVDGGEGVVAEVGEAVEIVAIGASDDDGTDAIGIVIVVAGVESEEGMDLVLLSEFDREHGAGEHESDLALGDGLLELGGVQRAEFETDGRDAFIEPLDSGEPSRADGFGGEGILDGEDDGGTRCGGW
jgi:hypothetical protein